MVQVVDQMQITSNIQKFWKLVFHFLQTSPTYREILKRIHWTMRFIPHISTPKKDWYGITYIAHIKDNVRMFLQCGLLIANRLEELAPVYMEKFKKSLRIPQVIPQKNKKRHIWDHSDTTKNFVS